MSNIYTFVDYTGFLSEVAETDLNFAGSWMASANYYRYDVVVYGAARYVCITANSNSAPPFDLQFNTYWSLIAFTSTGTSSPAVTSSIPIIDSVTGMLVTVRVFDGSIVVLPY